MDHGLRAESAAEAQAVASLCARLGIPHATLAVNVPPGNLQSAARDARYAALTQWAMARNIAALATAHHADDQAETLLMRLNRGSGVAGLAGIRAKSVLCDFPVLRPLLDWRKADLAQVVADAGLKAADDPSNSAVRFDRARLRKDLDGADWLDIAAAASSAGHLAEADEALEWAARRAWDESVARGGNGLAYCPGAPRAIALRVLARIVAEIGGGSARGSAIARLHDALARGESASLAGVLARPANEWWWFRPESRTRLD